MQKPGIFGNLEYSGPFHNCIPTPNQNPCIFTKIGRPCVILEIQNPGMLTSRAAGIFRILTYLKPDRYSEPVKDLRWSILQKYLKTTIVFPKNSILDLWQGSEYACLSISTNWPVEWPCALYCFSHIQKPAIIRTLSIILNSDIFRLIPVVFRHIQPYRGIFGTLCVSCMFRTLSYKESWHILDPRYIQNTVKAYYDIIRMLCNAYWEPCYI